MGFGIEKKNINQKKKRNKEKKMREKGGRTTIGYGEMDMYKRRFVYLYDM